MKITVYTANFGAKDTVKSIVPKDGVDYICFCDNPNFVEDGWNRIIVGNFMNDKRKQSRWFKMHPHVLFPNSDYTVWVDGRVQLKTNISNLISLLGTNHIATTRHRTRDCLYEEHKICEQNELDSKELMKYQIEQIENKGYPRNYGLSETGIVIRDNSSVCKKINNYWWEFIFNYSKRDQLSFNYILWAMKEKWSVVPQEYINIGRHNNAN
jgi:hypothetical protein